MGLFCLTWRHNHFLVSSHSLRYDVTNILSCLITLFRLRCCSLSIFVKQLPCLLLERITAQVWLLEHSVCLPVVLLMRDVKVPFILHCFDITLTIAMCSFTLKSAWMEAVVRGMIRWSSHLIIIFPVDISCRIGLTSQGRWTPELLIVEMHYWSSHGRLTPALPIGVVMRDWGSAVRRSPLLLAGVGVRYSCSHDRRSTLPLKEVTVEDPDSSHGRRNAAPIIIYNYYVTIDTTFAFHWYRLHPSCTVSANWADRL